MTVRGSYASTGGQEPRAMSGFCSHTGPEGAMTHARPVPPADTVALDRAVCLRLLDSGIVGRILYTAGALPAAHPVLYALRDEEVVFRTSDRDILRTAIGNEVVAFEIDDLEPGSCIGWTVLAVGRAHLLGYADRLTDLASCLPRPWAGERSVGIVAVTTRLLSGRRLVAPDPGGA